MVIDVLDFERKVQAAHHQLEAIQQYAEESPTMASTLLTKVIAEFSVALEELHTATEEIYVQNEQLTIAYQDLELKQHHYQELFEFAPDAYFVTDNKDTIQDANAAALELLNVPRRHFLIGKPLVVFIPETDRALFRSQLEQLKQHQRLRDWEIKVQRRNQAIVPVAISISPIHNLDDQIVGFRWLMRDLTERKKVEAMQQELQAEKELSELKSRFIRTMSHEFRTPLHVIQMAASVLERWDQGLSTEQRQQCLQKIPMAVRSLTQMLEKVLTYGRSEVKTLKFKPKFVNLEQFCRNVVKLHQLDAVNEQRIQLDLLTQSNYVYLDPILLQHILDNLLSNALKYSSPDCPVFLRVVGQADQVIIQVQDHGMGIPPEDKSRLLQPFHRAKNAENIPGTGLGLAIVKQAVELHHGTIELESQVGVGTTFTVTLPLPRSPQEDV